ncbi:MAG: tetratricopeptide (TPR) repeat protein, partial [Cocleimonas sp.]
STLDTLFFDLKHSEDETEARKLEEKIWLKWMESGDEKIDELLQQAISKRRIYDFNGSIEIINKIIKLKPDFPEAWNQRATLYFFQEKYEESLIDIAKTLELEPRHFGSLAGRAVIRWRQSKPVLARQNIIEALKVHPFLKEQNMFPGLQKS